MKTLTYISRELAELVKIAKADRHDLLAYLLEMAIAEAHEQMNREAKKADISKNTGQL